MREASCAIADAVLACITLSLKSEVVRGTKRPLPAYSGSGVRNPAVLWFYGCERFVSLLQHRHPCRGPAATFIHITAIFTLEFCALFPGLTV